jgi:hypothetical protein
VFKARTASVPRQDARAPARSRAGSVSAPQRRGRVRPETCRNDPSAGAPAIESGFPPRRPRSRARKFGRPGRPIRGAGCSGPLRPVVEVGLGRTAQRTASASGHVVRRSNAPSARRWRILRGDGGRRGKSARMPIEKDLERVGRPADSYRTLRAVGGNGRAFCREACDRPPPSAATGRSVGLSANLARSHAATAPRGATGRRTALGICPPARSSLEASTSARLGLVLGSRTARPSPQEAPAVDRPKARRWQGRSISVLATPSPTIEWEGRR